MTPHPAKTARFCPIPRPELLSYRFKRGTYRYSELGELEKTCCVCGEWWPADTEFYFAQASSPDGLTPACRACYMLRRHPERYPEVTGLRVGGAA